jgi:hypothetical protein
LIVLALFSSLKEIIIPLRPLAISRKRRGNNGHPYLILLDEEKKDEANPFINNA